MWDRLIVKSNRSLFSIILLLSSPLCGTMECRGCCPGQSLIGQEPTMTPHKTQLYPENQLPQHTKVCPKCGIEKPIDDFYRRNERVNRSSYCKKCCNAYKPKQTIFPTVKICCCVDCIHTGEEQSVSNFHRNHRKRDGYNPSCKDCVREASKRFRLNNPDKIRQWQKEWAEENPEKFNAKKTTS